MANEKEQEQPIIIKKVKKGGGGHHGGAWKVAYADFVTAMMAFFLLMWLLNVTTKEEKSAISNYFDPTNPKISQNESGAGGVLGGLSVAPEGAMVTNVQSITRPRVEDSRRRGDEDRNFSGDTETDTDQIKKSDAQSDQEFDLAEELKNLDELKKEELEKALEQLEDKEFEQIQEQIMDAIASSPELEGLAEHIKMEITPEGLLIQVIDNEGRSMFPSASAQMYPFMYDLLAQVASAISEKPNQLSIRGHTDSVPFPEGSTYTNWDLSADRAQSSRRAITQSGYPEDKIANVVGRADRDPFVPEDPRSAQNRRISMVLLRDRLTRPENIDEEELREKIENAGERLDEEAGAAERFRSRSEALRERRERISREREEQLLEQERERQERQQQQLENQNNSNSNTGATEFERERAPIERPNTNQPRDRQILEFD